MIDRTECLCGNCEKIEVWNFSAPGVTPTRRVLIPTGTFDREGRSVYETYHMTEDELERGSYLSYTDAWPPCQIHAEAKLVRDSLEWHKLSIEGVRWWLACEERHKESPHVILRLLEEVQIRQAIMEELFWACQYDSSDNIQIALDFLDIVIARGKKGRRLLREEFELAFN